MDKILLGLKKKDGISKSDGKNNFEIAKLIQSCIDR